MRISAVICTHNNANSLKTTINSQIEQEVNEDEFEILVVDNASTDNTRQIVLDFQREWSNLRYTYEEKLGISQARNKGIQDARGRYIAYIDDDVIANSNWISSFLLCLDRLTPTPDIIGGKILLKYEVANIPGYVSSLVEVYFSKIDYGNNGFFVNKSKLTHYFNSANLCINKKVFGKIGIFDTRLGSRGNIARSREETDIIEKAFKQNFVMYYEPAAGVTHFIKKHRLKRRYIFHRFFTEGVSQVLTEIKSSNISEQKFFHVRTTLRSILKKSYLFFKAPVSERFNILLSMSLEIGRLYGIMIEFQKYHI